MMGKEWGLSLLWSQPGLSDARLVSDTQPTLGQGYHFKNIWGNFNSHACMCTWVYVRVWTYICQCAEVWMYILHSWTCVFQGQILTLSVINSKTPQICKILSQDYFVVPSGLINSFNDFIVSIRVIKEGTIDSNSPWVGKMVHQDHSICTIHISSFDLKHQNCHDWLIDGEMRETFKTNIISLFFNFN